MFIFFGYKNIGAGGISGLASDWERGENGQTKRS
jgi:hypothetical protein